MYHIGLDDKNKCYREKKIYLVWKILDTINPLTPVSDQDRISPYYIYTISYRQVMRIKKTVNYGITNWSNIKFSKLT